MDSEKFPRRETTKIPTGIVQPKGRKMSWFAALNTLSTVTGWYRANHFASEEQARGAFELAWQQYLDGCGYSAEQWTGMTEDEIKAWVSHGELPPKAKTRRRAKPAA